MKLIIDIDDNVFTRLFDTGVDTSSDDREVIDRAVRNGMPYDERSQGEWLDIYSTHIAYECSNCHIQMPIYNYHFCPNCGAKMQKGGADNEVSI